MDQINPISYPLPQNLARLSEESPVLVAFSGGEDSSVLLHLLANDAKRIGFPLYAAHFNHKIRHLDAERDAEFCKNEAQRLGIPFFLGEADVPALAKEHGTGLEEEGRICRYEFFERVMEENGIRILVTAHHADDQAETVLLHLLRGSGVEGLRGIQPCRPFGKHGYIVRPLLQVEKARISLYALENHVPHVVDATNGDESYARNYLRSQVIPLLYRIQPSLASTVGRLAQNVGQANDFIEKEASDFLKDKLPTSLPLTELQKLHPAPRARAISVAFETVSGGSHLEKVHIDSLLSLCEGAQPHSSISLPRGFCGAIENGSLVLVRGNDLPCRTVNYEIPITEGVFYPNEKIKIDIKQVKKIQDSHIGHSALTLCISDESARGAVLRPRRAGDTIRVRKMTKSVKKIMNEKKLPLELRNALPMLALPQSNEVLWIPSVAIGDALTSAKPKPTYEGTVWQISITLNESNVDTCNIYNTPGGI